MNACSVIQLDELRPSIKKFSHKRSHIVWLHLREMFWIGKKKQYISDPLGLDGRARGWGVTGDGYRVLLGWWNVLKLDCGRGWITKWNKISGPIYFDWWT